MSRDIRYQKLLNSKRWMKVKRQVWQRAEGLCERCKRDGIAERGVPYITPGVDCHHKIPVESAKTEQEMERLAYDVNNIELLCIPCHIKTHKEMGKFTVKHLSDSKRLRAERTASWLDPNYKRNETGTMEADPDDGRQVRSKQLRTGEDQQQTPRAVDSDQAEERLSLRDGDSDRRQAEELASEQTGGHNVPPEPIRIA